MAYFYPTSISMTDSRHAHAGSKTWLHLGIIVIAILVAYLKVFHAGFCAWDDNEYVIANKDIRGFEYIGQWFSRFYIGNYHPLTLLSYAIDFALGGTSPASYHLTNILLHACTAVVLYFFINRLQDNAIVGLFVALVFALNPVQTETVSWIAERKTVLCGLFYMLALLSYTGYVREQTAKKLLVVYIYGICAMLSKGIGVALPMALLATDIWMQRGLTRKVWIEKMPLLVISLIVGIIAIKGQESGKFLNLHPEYNLADTVVFAGYAYIQYLIHFVVPYGLSVIYPYPQQVGWQHYLFLLLALALLASAFIAYRKKWTIVCGSILFYTANIALVLQFIQFGEFLMADRYLYIACIGIIYPVAVLLTKRMASLRNTIGWSVIAVICGLYLTLTVVRNDIWLNDFSFFNKILETYPNSAVAQFSVGGLYMRQGDYKEAEDHIDLAVQIDPDNYKAWYNKGALCLREKKIAGALEALNKCLAIRDYTKAYFTRALLYEENGKPELALPDIDRVLAEQPDNARANFIKADCLEQQGNAEESVKWYTQAIDNDGTDPMFYMRRGMLYGRMRQNEAALSDLNKAVELGPGNGENYYFRGIVKYHAGQDPCGDLRQAVSLGYRQATEALAKACGH
jgi:protein O-mannosyl-transferase